MTCDPYIAGISADELLLSPIIHQLYPLFWLINKHGISLIINHYPAISPIISQLNLPVHPWTRQVGHTLCLSLTSWTPEELQAVVMSEQIMLPNIGKVSWDSSHVWGLTCTGRKRKRMDKIRENAFEHPHQRDLQHKSETLKNKSQWVRGYRSEISCEKAFHPLHQASWSLAVTAADLEEGTHFFHFRVNGARNWDAAAHCAPAWHAQRWWIGYEVTQRRNAKRVMRVSL